jgi:hypothetical protein
MNCRFIRFLKRVTPLDECKCLCSSRRRDGVWKTGNEDPHFSSLYCGEISGLICVETALPVRIETSVIFDRQDEKFQTLACACAQHEGLCKEQRHLTL